MTFWRLLLTILLLITPAAAPATASMLVPAATDASAAEPAAEPQIDDTHDAGADARIAQRIRDIFGEIPALSDINVVVNQGVVSLDGSVSDAADKDRAERIASRVAGVVTVENAVERDVSVDGNLGGLGGLSGKIDSFLNLLPLIAVALGVALAISLAGYLIASLGNVWHRLAPNSFLAELIASAIRFVFVVGGVVIALDMIGATALLGAVLGGAGVVGIALGFAMRDTIENYVASLMLSLRQPFRANDHVVIDTMEGRVIRLTSRATVLMTLDGNHLRIPNSTVFKAVIVNYTRNPQRRFEFELGIDAEDDVSEARRLGVKVLRDLDFVLDTPEPSARVEEVGDSNIVIKFLGWIDQTRTDWFKARSEAIPAVKDALEGAGFALPEPIYRLRFDAGAHLPLADGNIAQAAPPRADRPAKKQPAKKQLAAAGTAAASEATASANASDVSPDTEVEKMVDAERIADPQDKDLLDHGRPVE